MNVFTYGSLMFPEVWSRASGDGGAGIPAALADHEVRALRGHSYPVMIPVPGAVARGVLYQNVSPAAVARLDEFEGSFYVRREVSLIPENGVEPVSAWTYLAAAPDHPAILSDPWDAAAFREQHLRSFLAEDPGFESGSGPPVRGAVSDLEKTLE